MVIPSFTFSRNPKIHFGAGVFNTLDTIIGAKAQTVVIVTGARSFRSTDKWSQLQEMLAKRSITFYTVTVSGEPSPELVDSAVSDYKDKNVDMVISIGGGSVVDAGKAISAMLSQTVSVVDFLEGVGSGEQHNGDKVPFIAVPTTAGTGSEATKNAVLSRIGPKGFKKSLRHDNFVPDIAVVDPELFSKCPRDVTAACGMDAFTQLLESYVSTNANPMTDALAYSGLSYVKESLLDVCSENAQSIDSWAGMAYGALISGITLANAGLGVVHGLASPLGGYFDIPHGVACGTLIGSATRVTIDKLKTLDGDGEQYLRKYAKAGALLSGSDSDDIDKLCGLLIDTIDEWTDILKLPSLKDYGIGEKEFDRIIDSTGNKNNPVKLDRDEIRKILE